jgi:hypothetical protein
MHLVDMITLLILLSLGPGYPIPGARISQAASEVRGEFLKSSGGGVGIVGTTKDSKVGLGGGCTIQGEVGVG